MMEPLDIEGVLAVRPAIHGDDRGCFFEWFRADRFRQATGHGFGLQQANCSVSSRGTLRGIHFASVPPGQAKYVTCLNGAILDVAIDLRVGSRSFGRWQSRELTSDKREALYLPEGIGHAFMALCDNATVVYLCSEPYAPEREHGIDPLDPELGIEWPPDVNPLLSEKDRSAPGLSEAAALGLLPEYTACQGYVASLRGSAPDALK